MDTETTEPFEMNSPSPLIVLQRKICRMRRKFLLVAAGGGFAAAIGTLVALLAVGIFLDWRLALGPQARAIMLIIDSTVFVFIIARYIVQPLVSAPDDDMLALMVERGHPQFRGRLISSVQLSRESTTPSPLLVRALVTETAQIAKDVDFGDSIAIGTFVRLAIGASLLAVLAITGYACTRPTSAALLRRAVLAETRLPQRATATAEIARNPNPSPGAVMAESQKRAHLKALLNRNLDDLSKVAEDEETLEHDLEVLIEPKAGPTN